MAKKKTMIEGFWDRFESCLAETKESKVAIGKRIGCNRKVLYDDFSGRAPLSIYVMRFCTEYGFSLDYLLGISKQMTAAALGMDVVDGFCERFEQCISETGDSQKVMAQKLGCNKKMLTGLMSKDRSLPSLLYIARFCSVYGYCADYILGISKDKRPTTQNTTSVNSEIKDRTPETKDICDWKPIPGYEGKYEASYVGNVRRLYKNRKPALMTAYEKKHRKGSRYLVVKLTNEGKSKEIKLSKAIYEAYKGKVPDGCGLSHVDGDFENNELKNLIVLTKEELGVMTGHKSKSKAVLKCSASLIPIETYRSAREAAKNNGMSYQTVIDRCNGKTKSIIAPDGYVYKWDETSNVA